MELRELQQRLEGQFHGLKVMRTGHTSPVFALEHGMDKQELGEATAALRSHLAVAREPYAGHWLVWVTLAAEIGYEFNGDIYWDFFEKRFPEWHAFSLRNQVRARNQIRDWFKRFASDYNGYVPEGSWAEHRTIISWPITHSILPRDLQLQFIRTMHALRFDLASEASVERFAKRFRERARSESTRFQQFVEHDELVRHLVESLVTVEASADASLLSPGILRRLTTDIESKRVAKEWLADTRKTFTRFNGAARPFAKGIQAPRVAGRASLRPSLILRRVEPDLWDIDVKVPDFVPLARENPSLLDALMSSKCSIAGGAGTWPPSTWLLSGPRKRRLQTWPDDQEALVRLKPSSPVMEVFLANETKLADGPIWLCRISDDGYANEILGRHVRPGREYALVHTTSLPSTSALSVTSACSTCAGIHISHLSVPQQFTKEAIAEIESLGLRPCQTVRMWPAGPAARAWDGDGYAEWLTTEQPCVGVISDHAVDSYSVLLNGDEHQIIKAPPPGQPIFLLLQDLTAGDHQLSTAEQKYISRAE